MQRWRIIQEELMPELRNEIGTLTPKLLQVVHILEWTRLEDFVSTTWDGSGRPEHVGERLRCQSRTGNIHDSWID